jgi:(1->4)-alpha-D-glucan 1-alpha-D-glucosylmutase
VNVRIPSATYRVQLNRGFTLLDAAAAVEYLHRLGISDCYSSPITTARAGSTHGYDVTDHRNVNPELGGVDALHALCGELQRRGMGLIVDTVPNHMCISDNSNEWWIDVLENGPSSPYASFFDIDWHPPKADLENKVLLPVLGDQFGHVLENGELVLSTTNGAFEVAYYDHSFPIAPRTWTAILGPALKLVEAEIGESSHDTLELASIITALNHLPLRTETDSAKIRERQREKEIARERLAALMETSEAVRTAVGASLAEFNGVRGNPPSFDRLEKLLDDQAYRLSFWRVASDEINYRRFFDINELAAIRVEEPEVFKATHELILGFVRQGLITGLRIDHVDGLRDPGQYLRTLQRECAASSQANGGAAPAAGAGSQEPAPGDGLPFYIVVEKILAAHEPLRSDWPIAGTTGYEFLNALNGLFVEGGNCERLNDFYARFTRQRRDFPEIVYESKRLVLRALMSGEQNVLARKLDRISEQHRWSRDFTLNSLGRVMAEAIACFPVYRSYVTPDGVVSTEDRREVMAAIGGGKNRNPALSGSTFDFLASVLLLESPAGLDDAALAERLDFVLRFQQLTSPVMAKGFEDTALYRYFPLASLNEVGGNPTSRGASVEEFHAANESWMRTKPHSLSATSTHDTKRGEDVRARINVLSEIPEQWERAVAEWHRLNSYLLTQYDGISVPDANEEYLFYQTLVGAWPLYSMSAEEHEIFIGRIQEYMNKAGKEAKVHTSWISPNTAHDEALAEFVRSVLQRDPENAFLAHFIDFRGPIGRAGMLNSLAQTLLKAASPGVPDFYQGSELWDYNLVDPDNRRPVDFAARRAALDQIIRDASRDRAGLVERLLDSAHDGRIKMYLIHRVLEFRRENPALFCGGDYLALEPQGEKARHVIAFARRNREPQLLVAAGRFFMSLGITADKFPPADTWSNTDLLLPPGFPQGRYVDLLTGAETTMGSSQGRTLPMGKLFTRMPLAMLVPSE